MSHEWIFLIRRGRFKTICTLSHLFEKDFLLSQVLGRRIVLILRFGQGNEHDELERLEEEL